MIEIPRQKFWKNFSKLNWEKKSGLFKNFKCSVSDMNQDQIFSMLVLYSNICRKNQNANGFKLFVDGEQQYDHDVLQILPVSGDKNFLGYHHRMEKFFSDYCLVCDELLQTSQNHWQKLTEFTDILFSHVGIPNRFVEMGLYIGNYKKTPFGVHVDGCGVFSFPVVGHKTFRLWKPEFAKKNPALDRAHNYSKFKKNSEILKATTNDMVYWPSSAWHIAESDGSFSATWSLGVWVDQPFHQTMTESFNPLLISKLGPAANDKIVEFLPTEKNGQIKKLPKNYLNAISAIQKISDDQLHDTFMQSWLLHRSKLGFKTTPVAKGVEKKLTYQSKIQIKNSENILWSKLKSDKKIIYAFRGIMIESNSAEFLNLIQNLNAGEICLISDYLTGVQKKSDLQLLLILIAAGWM